jgi:hypothetical protein
MENAMEKRGSQLLIAHMRSFDPDEPTARERLEKALGEDLARQIVLALSQTVKREAGGGDVPR